MEQDFIAGADARLDGGWEGENQDIMVGKKGVSARFR